MLVIMANMGGVKTKLRKFEDHGVGKEALKQYAISEFYGECHDAQVSANHAHQKIELELVDNDTGQSVITAKVFPAEINVAPTT